VRAARRRERLAQEPAQRLVVDPGGRVVGADHLRIAFDRDPLPAGPCHHRDRGTCAQVGELAAATSGDEHDHVDAGARSGRVRPGLVRDAAAAGLPVQASGGIRTLDDARALLHAGADRVIVGTAAWPDPTPWFELGDALVLALDVRAGQVRAAGWTESAGISLDAALEHVSDRRVLATAIDRDGTLAGPDLGLVAAVVAAGARVLAAGGVRSPSDVHALAAAGAEAAIVGRALLA